MEHAHTLQLYGTAGVRYNVEAMTRSDVQLMLDVKAGDEASFNLLLQKYRTPLVNFLYRMVRNRGTAEDLAQEVCLRAYRARKQYSPSAKFTTWLFRIATNLALNSLRDNRYRQMDVSIDAPVEEDVAPLQLPSRELRVDEKMIERDRSEFRSSWTARATPCSCRSRTARMSPRSSGLRARRPPTPSAWPTRPACSPPSARR